VITRVTGLLAPASASGVRLKMWWFAALVAVLLNARDALAQAPGDEVVIETDEGSVAGVIVDELPQGYLVRVGEETKVVEYRSIRALKLVPEPKPVEAPPEKDEPDTIPSTPPLSPEPPHDPVKPDPPPAPAWTYTTPEPPAPGRRGMVKAGIAMGTIGVLGMLAGALLLPIGELLRSQSECESADGSMTFDCDYGPGSDMMLAGAISLTMGANGFFGVAIPLVVVGSRPQAAPAVGFALSF
jgi:hypothetical protein